MVDTDESAATSGAPHTGKQSAPPSAPAKSPATKPGVAGNLITAKAKRFYYGMKNSPKFRNSKAIQKWNREFLSHEDLRKINAKYQKDRDAVAFMKAAINSPNFLNMAAKYFNEPDIKEFARGMMASEEVKAASGAAGEKDLVSQVGQKLELIGKMTPPRKKTPR